MLENGSFFLAECKTKNEMHVQRVRIDAHVDSILHHIIVGPLSSLSVNCHPCRTRTLRFKKTDCSDTFSALFPHRSLGF